MSDTKFRELVWLVSKGFKMEQVLEMDDEMRIGFCIIAQELDGAGKYNFDTKTYVKPK